MKLLVLALALFATLPQENVKFRAVDVYVEAGEAGLAAYQFELVADGRGEIVGVEGGEVASFKSAPYYDPAALQHGRIVIAAYTLDAAPSGKIRVARIHMQETGHVKYTVKLVTAANGGGERFNPSIQLGETK